MTLEPIKAYWWRPVPNFGDGLTPLLLQRLAKREPIWTPIEKSDLIVLGSVLDALPANYRGTILGAGKIRESTELALNTANVLALRGPLTAQGSGAAPEVLADPGLLAPMLRVLPKQTKELAVIPYVGERLPYEGYRIDLREPPLGIIKAVARCQTVVSSSLHGIILADALGLPRLWHPGRHVPDDEFKFRDYAASLGTPPQPHVWVEAPQERVQELQESLLKLFETLA